MIGIMIQGGTKVKFEFLQKNFFIYSGSGPKVRKRFTLKFFKIRDISLLTRVKKRAKIRETPCIFGQNIMGTNAREQPNTQWTRVNSGHT